MTDPLPPEPSARPRSSTDRDAALLRVLVGNIAPAPLPATGTVTPPLAAR